MNTQFHIPLIQPDSADGFQSINIGAENGSPSGWSVKSTTLRGGLQEGVSVVEVNNGHLAYAILPTRGMSIWKGQCGDVRLAWDSPVKDPVHPAFVNQQDRGGLGWLKGFNEWFVRCGLNSMGPPGIDAIADDKGNVSEVPLTLHGKIANLPARSVEVEVTDNAITVRGEVDETMMLGPALRLNTVIRTEFGSGELTITDTVTNLGETPQEHQMLYHINYGENLLEKGARFVAPFREVAPRDRRSTEGIEHFDQFGPPEAGFIEQVFFYQLIGTRDTRETAVMLQNAAGTRASILKYSLDDFPCFTSWKNTGAKADGYVTGIEPATSFPNSRQFEREKGRIITLDGGESRTTKITIETLETAKAVSEATAEIEKLRKLAEPKVHREPVAHMCS